MTPVSLITGFLGSGKTTAIRHLLSQVPTGEKWAVLVNEFGEIGIDGALLTQDGITVREIAGGCICCVSGPLFRVALTRILRELRPDRLLIEPSGLGHPAGIIDTLREPGFRNAVRLDAVVCLVDPTRLDNPKMTQHPIFRDQVMLADILLASKADLASEADMARFSALAGSLYPPKQRVDAIAQGHIDAAWLFLPGPVPSLGPDTDARMSPLRSRQRAKAETLPGADWTRIAPTDDADGLTGGWLIAPAMSFDRKKLADWIHHVCAMPGVIRVKGVFHCGRDWQGFNAMDRLVSMNAVAWRRDSRCELICEPGAVLDWDALDRALQDSLVSEQAA